MDLDAIRLRTVLEVVPRRLKASLLCTRPISSPFSTVQGYLYSQKNISVGQSDEIGGCVQQKEEAIELSKCTRGGLKMLRSQSRKFHLSQTFRGHVDIDDDAAFLIGGLLT